MSLNSFLNATPTKTQHPPTAAIVHHVRHIEAPPVVKRIVASEPAQQKPKPVVIKQANPIIRRPVEYIPRHEDLLTFSIFAKIILSKEKVEALNQIFMKVLDRKIEYQLVNLKVQSLLRMDQEVFSCWQMATQGNRHVFTNPLVSCIHEIVRWFIINEYTTSIIMEYFDFVVTAHDNEMSGVSIFSTILKQQVNITDAKRVAEMMRYTRKLMDALPLREKHKETTKMHPLNFQTFIGIDEPKKPFDLTAKIAEIIPLAKQAKAQQLQEHEQHPPHTHKSKNAYSTLKRVTPSHTLFQTPLFENQNPFIFNTTTKSAAVDPDIYGKYKSPPEFNYTVPVRDFFQVLENIEVNENKVDRIYAFSECNPYAGYCMRCAGKEAFKEQWTEIEQYLENKKVRDIVINRCRSQLPELEEEHMNTVDIASCVLETRVTNAFLESIKVKNMPNEFPFPRDNDEASAFLLHFLSTSANGKLTSGIQWFILTVIPLVQRDSIVEFIHSQTYASLLWHYTLFCDEIRALLNATPKEMNTFESVLDAVPEYIHNAKYAQTETQTTRLLTDIFKSIISHRVVDDKNAEECRKHFGTKIEHITHFLPLLERMCAECNFLRTDLHMQQLTVLSQNLGVFNNNATENQIRSRKGIYTASVRNIKLHKLVTIRISQDQGKIVITPFNQNL